MIARVAIGAVARRRLAALAVMAVAAGAACRDGATPPTAAPPVDHPAAPPAGTTPNQFYARGTPTFIRGTLGHDRADRDIAGQIEQVRPLFPGAPVVDDIAIDVAAGPAAWPPRPVLYGGPHAHHLVAALGRALPLTLERGRLVLGGVSFEGDDIRLIAVIPARARDAAGPGHPEFLLHAGTGDPGIAEINAIRHGGDPILVADGFGPLATGTWRADGDGGLTAVLSPRRPRIAWRPVDRTAPVAGGGRAARVRVLFPAQLAPAPDEAANVAACARGAAAAATRLDLADPPPLSIYLYPDRRSKQSLTGDAGDGHAVPAAGALHVVAGPGLEPLVAHEATHVVAHASWGPAGSALLGEGLAVWVSGQYGGVSLADWRARLGGAPRLADLLGPGFRRLPEPQTYPVAGLLVQAAIDRVGLAAVRDHLYGATAGEWDRACARAGTSPRELEEALARAIAP